MGKRRNLTIEEYIEETTTNIREDRAMAKSLDRWFDTAIEALIPDRPRTGPSPADGYYMPVPTPDDYGMTIVK